MEKKRFDVEIPDGQHLGFSRGTDGAYRAHLFDDETNGLVGHAELFEVPADASDSPYDQYVYVSDSTGTKTGELTDEEFEELLRGLVSLAIIVATLAAAAAPQLRNWWHGVALPVMKSGSQTARVAIKMAGEKTLMTAKSLLNKSTETWRQGGGATRESAPESEAVIADSSSNKVEVAFRSYRARMDDSEARERFAAALLARAFSDEQLRLLGEAEFENDPESRLLHATMGKLTQKQVTQTLSLLLEKNPSLLERKPLAELAVVVSRTRSGRNLPLKLEAVTSPLA